MKQHVTRFKSLAVAIKELGPFIRNGLHLRSGKPFKRLNMRSREALANWLLCVAVNHVAGADRLTFTSDPAGGDGIIYDTVDDHAVMTEHVYVPGPNANGNKTPEGDVKSKIIAAVAQKQAKGGKAYATGKTLVVFSDAVGEWKANVIARELSAHDFEMVWVAALQGVENGRYIYNVARLDLRRGNAPVWRVTIAAEFTSWTVEAVQ